MSYRRPGRQWRSRLSALGGAHMAGPLDLNAPVIPYPGPPASWSYGVDTLSLNVGVPMTPLTVTVLAGVPYGWFAHTPLPAGLVVNGETGTLSGTPTVVAPSRGFLVASRSRGGAFYHQLRITVSP